MFQIFWEFAASQNKNEINDNKQVNWESVIFQVMGTSTCYLSSNHLFFLYSLQGHFSNRWRDKQFNMTLPFQKFFHFLSFCLCFCLCLSLSVSCFPLVLPFMIYSCFSAERGFCYDSPFQTLGVCTCWHQHHLIITLSLAYPHVCTHLSHAAALESHIPCLKRRDKGKN